MKIQLLLMMEWFRILLESTESSAQMLARKNGGRCFFRGCWVGLQRDVGLFRLTVTVSVKFPASARHPAVISNYDRQDHMLK